jgi:hypothetical protein
MVKEAGRVRETGGRREENWDGGGESVSRKV